MRSLEEKDRFFSRERCECIHSHPRMVCFVFAFLMSVQSTFIPTTGCANEPTDKSVYRWRCINPGNGNLGFRAGCAEIQLDSSLNASSSWGTGCYGRVDTFYLRQLAFPSTRCRNGYFNVLDLKRDALGFLLTYAECVVKLSCYI